MVCTIVKNNFASIKIVAVLLTCGALNARWESLFALKRALAISFAQTKLTLIFWTSCVPANKKFSNSSNYVFHTCMYNKSFFHCFDRRIATEF